MFQHLDGDATEVLRRLEDVRSAEEAQEAAQAFRAWIASGMVATPSGISKKAHALDEESLGLIGESDESEALVRLETLA
jgi:hypothetical protein